MRREHTAMAPVDHAVEVPTSARLAATLLVVVGLANLAVGVWGLTGAAGELAPGIAIGLSLAGAGTTVLGGFVWLGRLWALYVALVVFEVLLIPRLLTLGEAGGGTWASLVLLLALVVVLWVATVRTRRLRSPSAEPDAPRE